MFNKLYAKHKDFLAEDKPLKGKLLRHHVSLNPENQVMLFKIVKIVIHHKYETRHY